MTVKELKTELEKRSIAYSPTATKPELQKILDGAMLVSLETMSDEELLQAKIKGKVEELQELYLDYAKIDRNKSPRLRQAIALVNQSYDVCKF